MSVQWVRRGRIFDPAQHPVPFAPQGYAQSPQALVLLDRVRVYYAARTRDDSGKFLSQVSYVDFDRHFERVIGVAERPVIPLGGLGCFDEHGIFPFHVLHDGERIQAYTTGWNRRASVPTDAAIGLAVSRDGGTSFERMGPGPVLAPSLHEPFLVGDAFVMRRAGLYLMWYIHGVRWIRATGSADAERVYKIAQASSPDGVNWRRKGGPIIEDVLGPDECQALPTVIEHAGRFHMLFCHREAIDFRCNPSRAYRLGHAWSDDLESWHRDDSQWVLARSRGGWDSEMICYPHLCRVGEQIYLLYNGNQFGRWGFGLAQLEAT